jgi:hypothetical protein
MDNQDLGRYQGMMPSRAVLARLSIFGLDEATRASANAILKALPPMNERERREYYDETWKLAGLPSEEDLLKSPIGKATLEMLKNSSLPKEVQTKAEGNAPVAPDPAAGGSESPAEPEVDPVNPNLEKLSWPPKGTLLNSQPKTEEPPRDNLWSRFVAGTPSPLDTGPKPIADSTDCRFRFR